MDWNKGTVHFSGTLQEKLKLLVSELKNYENVYQDTTNVYPHIQGMHRIYEEILDFEKYNSEPPKVRTIEDALKLPINKLLAMTEAPTNLLIAYEKITDNSALKIGYNSTVSLMNQIENLVLKARFKFTSDYYAQNYYEQHIKGPLIKAIQKRELYYRQSVSNINNQRETLHANVCVYDSDILPEMREHFRYFWFNNCK
jgi:hypothetical protein